MCFKRPTTIKLDLSSSQLSHRPGLTFNEPGRVRSSSTEQHRTSQYYLQYNTLSALDPLLSLPWPECCFFATLVISASPASHCASSVQRRRLVVVLARRASREKRDSAMLLLLLLPVTALHCIALHRVSCGWTAAGPPTDWLTSLLHSLAMLELSSLLAATLALTLIR